MKLKIIAKDKKHLQSLIEQKRKLHGNKYDLNHIDISLITDMSFLFNESPFNGNISQWNTSHVEDISHMFQESHFNGDISKWDVSNIKDMLAVFFNLEFNGDISGWNVSNVNNMSYMFSNAKFSIDISCWNVENVIYMQGIFYNCNIEKPWWAIEDDEKRKEVIKKYNLMKKLDETLMNKEKVIQPKKNKI